MSTYTSPDADASRFLTVSQAARILAVHPLTVRRWIHDGRLPAYRIGEKGVRVVLTDVLDLATPLQYPAQKEGHMNTVDQRETRRLTEEEVQRGLRALAEFDVFDEEEDISMVPDSTELIRQMREERTGELMAKLGE